MTANKSPSRSSARRPQGAVAPAQRRRRQAAAAATTDRPTTAAARRNQGTALLDRPRWTRDRILGWGAGLGAFLALASLTAPALALFFGLLYAAVAFLRPSDRKQTQLTVSTAAIALWVLLSTVILAILLATTTENGDEEQASDILTGGYLAVSLASGVAITLAVALAALAFYNTGRRRHRLFSWSGLCLTAYYVLFLPSAVGGSAAPSTLGSFWEDAVGFGRIVFGVIAGLTMAAAFWWHGAGGGDEGEAAEGGQAEASGSAHGSGAGALLTFGEREYLLAIAAVLLLLSRLADFAFVDWGSLRPVDDQTTSEAVFQALIFLAVLLRLPVLFGAATLAFWTSARRAGWTPVGLLDAPAAGPAARSQATRLLLSWRLPLLLVWLIVLIAASSFLGWYGFLIAVPAAVHYLRMLTRERAGPTQSG